MVKHSVENEKNINFLIARKSFDMIIMVHLPCVFMSECYFSIVSVILPIHLSIYSYEILPDFVYPLQ